MESPGEGSHVITLDEQWLNEFKKRVAEAEWKRWRSEPATIFRVPQNIRDAEPEAYEPKIVSLGPYHHDKAKLKAMDDLKWLYLKNFLSRTSPGAPESALEPHLKRIKALEARARSAYSEPLDMASNDLVKLLLLDGCFLVELFAMRTEPRKSGVQAEEDPIISTTWTLPLLVLDLLMLENQIPFFLLQDLYDSVFGQQAPNSLVDLVFDFLDNQDILPMSRLALDRVSSCHHILHLFHSSILPVRSPGGDGGEGDEEDSKSTFGQTYFWRNLPSLKTLSSSLRRTVTSSVHKLIRRNKLWRRRREEPSRQPTPESIPCATELKEAGVVLRRRRRRKRELSFLEIRFRSGTMEIPQIHVYDQAHHLFRNIIAFEQCYPDAGSDVTAYAVIMDCIVDTPADVALLQRRRIVVNGLGNDEELAELFNKLCKEVSISYDDCYLSDVFVGVNKHCSYRVNRWRAKLSHDYFSSPWVIISVLAAFVLLLLTVAQTLFTVLSYVNPP